MSDIMRHAFTDSIPILTVVWLSGIVFVIKHDIAVTEMVEHYKKENARLKEEIKDMQWRINTLLNINTETNEINWNEEE